eukprot:1180616-Prorocentrum_minimum.AAC.2
MAHTSSCGIRRCTTSASCGLHAAWERSSLRRVGALIAPRLFSAPAARSDSACHARAPRSSMRFQTSWNSVYCTVRVYLCHACIALLASRLCFVTCVTPASRLCFVTCVTPASRLCFATCVTPASRLCFATCVTPASRLCHLDVRQPREQRPRLRRQRPPDFVAGEVQLLQEGGVRQQRLQYRLPRPRPHRTVHTVRSQPVQVQSVESSQRNLSVSDPARNERRERVGRSVHPVQSPGPVTQSSHTVQSPGPVTRYDAIASGNRNPLHSQRQRVPRSRIVSAGGAAAPPRLASDRSFDLARRSPNTFRMLNYEPCSRWGGHPRRQSGRSPAPPEGSFSAPPPGCSPPPRSAPAVERPSKPGGGSSSSAAKRKGRSLPEYQGGCAPFTIMPFEDERTPQSQPTSPSVFGSGG